MMMMDGSVQIKVTGAPIECLKSTGIRFSLWAESEDKFVTVFCDISYPLTSTNMLEDYVNRHREELITLVIKMLENQIGIISIDEKLKGFLIIECIDSTAAAQVANRINGRKLDGSEVHEIFDDSVLTVANEPGSKTVIVSGIPTTGALPQHVQNRQNTIHLVDRINFLGILISAANCSAKDGEIDIGCQSVEDAQEVVRRIMYYSQRRFIQDFLSKATSA